MYNCGKWKAGKPFFCGSSQYYQSIPLAQLLYAGDDVSGEEWDSRNCDTKRISDMI